MNSLFNFTFSNKFEGIFCIRRKISLISIFQYNKIYYRNLLKLIQISFNKICILEFLN